MTKRKGFDRRDFIKAALETAKADACRTCAGFCEKACPYGVPVRTLLSLAHGQLSMP